MSAFAVVLVPLIAAAGCLLPIGPLAGWLAVASGAIGALVGLSLLIEGGLAGEASAVWAAPLGAQYHVGANGFGAALLATGGLLFAVGAAASRGRPNAYHALWCALQAAVSGVFIAQDLLLFFLFWEAMLVPLAILMWQWGGEDRRRATLRFLIYTMAGSALLLAGTIATGIAARTFDVVDLARSRPDANAQTVLAVLFLGAFAVKLPLFPFHAWLPRAYAAAPVPVALVLSGVVAKTAAYGIAHLCFGLFPDGMARLAPLLVSLAAVGALYGAVLATRQRDLRGVIAFSSLSHLDLIGLALFAGTLAGAQAAAVASVSHAVLVAALFLLAEMLATRRRTFAIPLLAGLGATAPVLAATLTFVVVGVIGVPGTSGFAGEILVLSAAFARFPAAGALATLVVIVAAVYGLRLLHGYFFGPAREGVADLSWRERVLLAPLLAAVLLVGFAPRIIADRVAAPGEIALSR